MPDHAHCRICRSDLPPPFLDFGRMPLANSFPASPSQFEDEPSYPLAVAACGDCGLMQLTYTVPAELLYRDYIYVSATSEAVRAHAANLAATLTRRYDWGPSDLVVEVASNDGTVLKEFKRHGVRVLGVEPARNLATVATADGIPTLPEFFNEDTAALALTEHGAASAVIGRHVFAHVDDVHGFVRGASRLLAPDGVLLIEVPYLGNLVDHLEFDTIYHEHLSYFGLRPIDRLVGMHGLRVTGLDWVDLHGGSMMLHIRRSDLADVPDEGLEAARSREDRQRLSDRHTLETFATRVRHWRERFEQFVDDLVGSGAVLIGYGAAAKANTLLNYCPAAAGSLRSILDRNPYKHGRYTPGTHVPIKPAECWEQERATHMLLLAWNFQPEIVRQMQPFAAGGGRFVVPIPEPRLV